MSKNIILIVLLMTMCISLSSCDLVNQVQKNEAYYEDLASKYESSKSYDLAIQNYKMALTKGGDEYGICLSRLASLYLNKADYNQAIIYYKKHLANDPQDTYTLNEIGKIYLKTKKYDLAIQYFKKSVSVDPEYAQAYFNLGNTYALMDKFDIAIFNMEKANYLKREIPIYSNGGN